jgi:hypothetical protein
LRRDAWLRLLAGAGFDPDVIIEQTAEERPRASCSSAAGHPSAERAPTDNRYRERQRPERLG